MTAQTDQDLSRREEMTVSSAAMSAAPWGTATVTGGVVAAGDLGLHLIGGGLGLGAVSGSVAMGAVAFFVGGAGGGALGGAVKPRHPLGAQQPVAVRRAAGRRGRRGGTGDLGHHRRRYRRSGTERAVARRPHLRPYRRSR